MLLRQFFISSFVLFRLSYSIVTSSDDETIGKIGIVEPEWKKVKGSHSRFLTAHHILQRDQVLGDREIPGRNISRLKPKFLRKYSKIRSRKNIAPHLRGVLRKRHYATSFKTETIPGHSNKGSFNRIRITQTNFPAVRHSVDSSHLPDALLLYPSRKTSQQAEIAFAPALPILRSSRSSILPYGTSKTSSTLISN